MEPVGFEGVVGFIANNKALATRYLAEYFDRSEPDGGFTGRWFEHFSALSDELHLDANDVAAAATLSVPLDGSTVRSLFERAEELNGLPRSSPQPRREAMGRRRGRPRRRCAPGEGVRPTSQHPRDRLCDCVETAGLQTPRISFRSETPSSSNSSAQVPHGGSLGVGLSATSHCATSSTKSHLAAFLRLPRS
jgi:hypothetical protein